MKQKYYNGEKYQKKMKITILEFQMYQKYMNQSQIKYKLDMQNLNLQKFQNGYLAKKLQVQI